MSSVVDISAGQPVRQVFLSCREVNLVMRVLLAGDGYFSHANFSAEQICFATK